jgi:hypothetical protein
MHHLDEAQLETFLTRVIRQCMANGQTVEEAPVSAALGACAFLLHQIPLAAHQQVIGYLQVILHNREAYERGRARKNSVDWDAEASEL